MGKCKKENSSLHSGGLTGRIRWVIFLESKKGFFKIVFDSDSKSVAVMEEL